MALSFQAKEEQLCRLQKIFRFAAALRCGWDQPKQIVTVFRITIGQMYVCGTYPKDWV